VQDTALLLVVLLDHPFDLVAVQREQHPARRVLNRVVGRGVDLAGHVDVLPLARRRGDELRCVPEQVVPAAGDRQKHKRSPHDRSLRRIADRLNCLVCREFKDLRWESMKDP
jgi:hypothetical protein